MRLVFNKNRDIEVLKRLNNEQMSRSPETPMDGVVEGMPKLYK